MGNRYRRGRGSKSLHEGVTLELNLQLMDAGREGMLGKSDFGRVGQTET